MLVVVLSSCATSQDEKHIEVRCSECADLVIIIDNSQASETPVGVPMP